MFMPAPERLPTPATCLPPNNSVRTHCEQLGEKRYITQMNLFPQGGGTIVFKCHQAGSAIDAQSQHDRSHDLLLLRPVSSGGCTAMLANSTARRAAKTRGRSRGLIR